jgi:GTPase SAR1 family protein
MADLQLLGLIEPGEHSPTTTASLDEVVSMVCNPAPETPIDNLAAPGSAAPVAAEKGEPSFHSDQQEALHTSLEYPPPIGQTPHPDPLADSWLQVEAPPRNIIFFGETGVGKSAIINMLREKSQEQFDDAIAVVSNAALGCTLVSTRYPCRLCDEVLMLWDTAGLVEGEFGNVTAGRAEDNLVGLLQTMEGGVSLLVYCIRARRFRTIIKSHYELFFEKTCGRKVPIVLVVTGLENEEFMEDWWVRNQQEFRRRGIHFTGHACITSTRGKAMAGGGHVFDDEYEESFKHLRGVIFNCYSAPIKIQSSGSKGPSLPTFKEISARAWEFAKKKIGKATPDISSFFISEPSNDNIVDDTHQPVYNTAGVRPPQPITAGPDNAGPPASAHTRERVGQPVHRNAGTRLPPLVKPRSPSESTPAVIHTMVQGLTLQPQHTAGYRFPYMAKPAPYAPHTAAPAPPEASDDIAQRGHPNPGPQPLQKESERPRNCYVFDGNEFLAFPPS